MDEIQRLTNYRERAQDNWLVLAYDNNPIIRLDACLLDRLLVDDQDLILAVGDLTVSIPTMSVEAAARIGEMLSPYTRSTGITQQASYENAKLRLEATDPSSLFFGTDAVLASDEVLYVGSFICSISDVEKYAAVGAELPMPTGRLQAALAMLVVTARNRVEDFDALALRVAEYEAALNNSTVHNGSRVE